MPKYLSAVFLCVVSMLFFIPSYAMVTCTAVNARGMVFPPVTGPYHFAWTSAYNECLASSRYCSVNCTGYIPPAAPMWRCSATGPNGGNWNGVGPTQQMAMNAAMNNCYNNKPAPGMCTPAYSSCYMR
jgi:hypothetical protein